MSASCDLCGPLLDAKPRDPPAPTPGDPTPNDPCPPHNRSVTVRTAPLELKSSAVEGTCMFCKLLWDAIIKEHGGEEPFNGYRPIQIRRDNVSDNTAPLTVRVPGPHGKDSDKEFQFYLPESGFAGG